MSTEAVEADPRREQRLRALVLANEAKARQRKAREARRAAARPIASPRRSACIADAALRQQRLDLANAVRLARVELKAGRRSLYEVICEPPDYALGMSVADLLAAPRRRGPVLAARTLRELRIPVNAKVISLTGPQWAALKAEVGRREARR